MLVTKTAIPDVLVLEPRCFGDERGFFYESYNEEQFCKATGLRPHFVQDNHSKSLKSVLRGLHFQVAPRAQGKLVRVVLGEVYDVAVDIRPDSPTYGQWVAEILSAENRKQLWVPEGFAHGFCVLSDEAHFLYKTTDFYSKAHERCIAWDDATLAIDWPLSNCLVSDKDRLGLSFAEATQSHVAT